jgi:hypothetical protein
MTDQLFEKRARELVRGAGAAEGLTGYSGVCFGILRPCTKSEFPRLESRHQRTNLVTTPEAPLPL